MPPNVTRRSLIALSAWAGTGLAGETGQDVRWRGYQSALAIDACGTLGDSQFEPPAPLSESAIGDARAARLSGLAIDLISGSELLRTWVDDPAATCADLEVELERDEADWAREREPFIRYR